jgi:hypothetical protein
VKPPYHDSTIVLTSKHHKARAIAPPFTQHLGARVDSCELDTDQLGTFSGEVERDGDALHCARRKCNWGMDTSGSEFGLASEGSFGPHPVLPFIAMGHELLLFIDRQRGFELHLAQASEETNFRSAAFADWDEARGFAQKARFPSHALIVRPDQPGAAPGLVKGITTEAELKAAFSSAKQASDNGKAWLETDMRAHLNPTRMQQIGLLAGQLARRLACACPACNSPGWGQTGADTGLPCAWCGTATALVMAQRHGCVSCEHEQRLPRPDGLTVADPGRCPVCNP